jgi:acetate kinase
LALAISGDAGRDSMMPAILSLNAGSSSIKFALYRYGSDAGLAPVYKGLLDKHGDHRDFVVKDAAGNPVRLEPATRDEDGADPATLIIGKLEHLLGEVPLVAVGHRIVHGGPDFADPVVLTEDVVTRLEALTPLAPLHQPGCLAPVRPLLAARPKLLQVACFDTAFHRGLGSVYRTFPLPELERGIHRYGFHGLSFDYIARQLPQTDARVVMAHLGNGASLCALRNGQSVNTTMSLTPLDGLMMATRSGSIDPGLLIYLLRSSRMSIDEVEDLLYHRSGLLGLSGLSADMRALLASDEPKADAAIEQFCARAAEHVAVMATSLRGVDALIFTGGIGENSAEIRRRICDRLDWLGLALDRSLNEQHSDTISAHDSRVTVRVIATDEEQVIATRTLNIWQDASSNRSGQ